MAGYRQQERRSLGKVEVVASGLAIVASMLCLLFAAVTAKLIAPIFGIFSASPAAPAMWVLASTFLMRSSEANEHERLSPQTLRRLALGFFVLGAAMMVVSALV